MDDGRREFPHLGYPRKETTIPSKKRPANEHAVIKSCDCNLGRGDIFAITLDVDPSTARDEGRGEPGIATNQSSDDAVQVCALLSLADELIPPENVSYNLRGSWRYMAFPRAYLSSAKNLPAILPAIQTSKAPPNLTRNFWNRWN